MAESSQQKLTRVRRPRIQITYEVETGGAMEIKELPFVVGVVGDFIGDSKPDASLKNRDFVEITGVNFNDVMSKLKPTLNLTKQDDKVPFDAKLSFDSIDDFHPDSLVELDPEAKKQGRIPELDELLTTRSDLIDLVTFVNRSPELEGLLEDILFSVDQDGKPDPAAGTKLLNELKSALPSHEGGAGPESDPKPADPKPAEPKPAT